MDAIDLVAPWELKQHAGYVTLRTARTWAPVVARDLPTFATLVEGLLYGKLER